MQNLIKTPALFSNGSYKLAHKIIFDGTNTSETVYIDGNINPQYQILAITSNSISMRFNNSSGNVYQRVFHYVNTTSHTSGNGTIPVIYLSVGAGSSITYLNTKNVGRNRIARTFLRRESDFYSAEFTISWLNTASDINQFNFACGSGVTGEIYILQLIEDTSLDVANIRYVENHEIFTGNYWTDGKPIFRKTINCGALPNNTTKTINHDIVNLDYIVDSFAESTTSTSSVFIPLTYSSSNTLDTVCYYFTSTQIYIWAGIDRTSFTRTFVTLFYTKQ